MTTAPPHSKEIVVIDYDDLLRFYHHSNEQQRQKQPPSQSMNTRDNIDHHDASLFSSLLLQKIEQAFGSNGYGIIGISNVPHLEQQRYNLLSLSRILPSVPDIETKLVDPSSYYSVGWSHGKEQFQNHRPDTSKGSYYANPITDDLYHTLYQRYHSMGQDTTATSTTTKDEKKQDSNTVQDDNDPTDHDTTRLTWSYIEQQAQKNPELYAKNIWPSPHDLPMFQESFCTLGQTLIQVGTYVASLCDVYVTQQQQKQIQSLSTSSSSLSSSPFQLCSMIQQSKNVKGRLLHYFASSSSSTTQTEDEEKNESSSIESSLWCAWHNDHVRFFSLSLSRFRDVIFFVSFLLLSEFSFNINNDNR
jgi:hypothetical protein